MSTPTIHDSEYNVSIDLYTAAGHICSYYIFNDNFPKRIAAYYSIKQDIKECTQSILYLKEMLKNEEIPNHVKSSLLAASAVKYARCFSDAEEGRKTSLEKDVVFRGANPRLLEIHKEIISMRNDYFAHAGKSEYETGVMVGYLLSELVGKQIINVVFASRRYEWDESFLDDFLSLLEFMHTYTEGRISDMKSTFERFLETLDIEEVYSKSKYPKKIFASREFIQDLTGML